MTTVGSLVARVRRQVYGMHRSSMNKLANALTDSGTEVTLTYDLKAATAGAFLGIGDELLYIWEANTANKSLIVERGELGTTPAAYTTGTLVEVGPRFPVAEIRDALRDEIRSWYPDLFVAKHGDYTVTDNEQIILPLVGDSHRILNVQLAASNGDWIRPATIQTRRDLPSGTVYNGFVIRFPNSPVAATTARVSWAADFDLTDFTDSASLEDDVGLSPSMFDLAMYGAAWRLVSTREVKRTFTEAQGEPRHAEEVPPMHIAQTAQSLQRIRDQRFKEEVERMLGLYPWRLG